MVKRPPFDNGAPPPGGFDPRFNNRPEADPRYGGGQEPRFASEPDPRFAGDNLRFGGRPDPRYNQPDPFDRRHAAAPPPLGPARTRSNRWLYILGALLLLGAVFFGLSLTRSGPGSDAIDGAGEDAQEKAAAADPEERCAAPATYQQLKRELFRQAAATRGSDQAAFDRLAGYSALRVTKPVLREEDEGLERVSCTADIALDLPPGVQVVGGRRTLSGNIGYNLQPAADRTGDVVTLSGAESIIVPLATLARSGGTPRTSTPSAPADALGTSTLPRPTAPPPAQAPAPAQSPSQANPPASRPPQASPPAPPAATPPSASVRPSFNCARARTRGEIAVCNSAELAALDRQMAGFYQNAYRGAEPEARALLERTRRSFLTFRDRCGSDRCIADAYRGRITEIRDIVDGRWRGN